MAKDRKVTRDTRTGRFVRPGATKRRPATTVRQIIKRKK